MSLVVVGASETRVFDRERAAKLLSGANENTRGCMELLIPLAHTRRGNDCEHTETAANDGFVDSVRLIALVEARRAMSGSRCPMSYAEGCGISTAVHCHRKAIRVV